MVSEIIKKEWLEFLKELLHDFDRLKYGAVEKKIKEKVEKLETDVKK